MNYIYKNWDLLCSESADSLQTWKANSISDTDQWLEGHDGNCRRNIMEMIQLDIKLQYVTLVCLSTHLPHH